MSLKQLLNQSKTNHRLSTEAGKQPNSEGKDLTGLYPEIFINNVSRIPSSDYSLFTLGQWFTALIQTPDYMEDDECCGNYNEPFGKKTFNTLINRKN